MRGVTGLCSPERRLKPCKIKRVVDRSMARCRHRQRLSSSSRALADYRERLRPEMAIGHVRNAG